MSALLEVPAIRQRAFPVSVELYHRLTEGLKTELLRGTIIEKVSKSPLHIFTVTRLHKILAGQIGPECTIIVEGAISTADSEPEPDLCVVRGGIEQFRTALPATAEFVAEVAVSSLEIDRVKAEIYAEAGVKEYWIVCPSQKRVEVYLPGEPNRFGPPMVASAPAVLESTALPGVKVDLGELFA